MKYEKYQKGHTCKFRMNSKKKTFEGTSKSCF